MTLKSIQCYKCKGEVGYLSLPFLLNKQMLVYICDKCILDEKIEIKENRQGN